MVDNDVGGDEVVEGIVLDEGDAPLPAVIVEVWDRDLLRDDYLGRAITDADGRFRAHFPQRRFRDLGVLERRPDIYFRVLRDSTAIFSTIDHDLTNIANPPYSVTLRVTRGAPESPPPVMSPLPIDPEDTRARLGSEVSPSRFGEDFAALVFTADMLAGQIGAVVKPRELHEEETTSLGPIDVRVTTDAKVADPEVRQVTGLEFDVTVPVHIRVRVQGELGPLEAGEVYAVSARARFRLTVRFYDHLKIYIEASRVAPGHVELVTIAESVTSLARSEVEARVRQTLAARFNQSLTSSLPGRTIDLFAEVKRVLGAGGAGVTTSA
jgi:uncharacterized protein YejL (UPF0352 family)